MAQIGIGASFEQFPSYTECILRTLKTKILFSVYLQGCHDEGPPTLSHHGVSPVQEEREPAPRVPHLWPASQSP